MKKQSVGKQILIFGGIMALALGCQPKTPSASLKSNTNQNPARKGYTNQDPAKQNPMNQDHLHDDAGRYGQDDTSTSQSAPIENKTESVTPSLELQAEEQKAEEPVVSVQEINFEEVSNSSGETTRSDDFVLQAVTPVEIEAIHQ